MNITVIGRGNVGGGLARRWEQAGHEVSALGREGGDASGADVVVVAVPSSAIADALAKVTGIEGKIASRRRTRSADAPTVSSHSHIKRSR
jgi:8-hydroxy-5-deazaflavin:NADPH oxidoreductase